MLKTVLDVLVEVAVTVLSAVLIALFKQGIGYIKSKTESVLIKTVMGEVEKTIDDGINYTEQTMVSAFKSTETWTKEAQYEALQHCVNYIISNLSNKTTQFINDNGGDIRGYITAKVEAKIQKNKQK